jgi:hypothetical protein
VPEINFFEERVKKAFFAIQPKRNPSQKRSNVTLEKKYGKVSIEWPPEKERK